MQLLLSQAHSRLSIIEDPRLRRLHVGPCRSPELECHLGLGLGDVAGREAGVALVEAQPGGGLESRISTYLGLEVAQTTNTAATATAATTTRTLLQQPQLQQPP